MRRLFSTFARGGPGAGLLVMRLVAGIALIDTAIMKLQVGSAIGPAAILSFLTAVAGILLLAGLWTPMMGVMVATIELWNAFSQPGDP